MFLQNGCLLSINSLFSDSVLKKMKFNLGNPRSVRVCLIYILAGVVIFASAALIASEIAVGLKLVPDRIIVPAVFGFGVLGLVLGIIATFSRPN